MRPLGLDTSEGDVAATLGGGRFPQEFPTLRPSHVLNGGIFGLWGCYDVGASLADRDALALWQEGAAGLAANLDSYGTGSWSRYDLYPHPSVNVAHAGYHRLHVSQL